MLLFKWHRYVFILIAFEFIMINIFYSLALFGSGILFFFFLCMAVVSRVLGIVLIVAKISYYGSDMCLFC